MSMSAYANYAYIIQEHDLRSLSLEINDIIDEMHKVERASNETLNDFALDEDPDEYPSLYKLYMKLVDLVEKETGLKIYIGYHGEGDRGDDIPQNSYYWFVLEEYLFKPTEAYIKNKDIIRKRYFVEVG